MLYEHFNMAVVILKFFMVAHGKVWGASDDRDSMKEISGEVHRKQLDIDCQRQPKARGYRLYSGWKTSRRRL